MSKHKPIEPKPTQYGNILFRSKLEARWAVFLDFTENVLNWEYEPTVFKLPNGWTYTPDFLVTSYRPNRKGMKKFYLEVKPREVSDGYLHTLNRFVGYHKITLLLAEGSFYKDLYLQFRVLPKSTPSFNPANIFSNITRSVYHAEHFRFDLKG